MFVLFPNSIVVLSHFRCLFKHLLCSHDDCLDEFIHGPLPHLYELLHVIAHVIFICIRIRILITMMPTV